MATLINLRQVRKLKEREQRAEAAAEQRVRHGRSLAEKHVLHARLDRETALLDGHHLGLRVDAQGATDETDNAPVTQ